LNVRNDKKTEDNRIVHDTIIVLTSPEKESEQSAQFSDVHSRRILSLETMLTVSRILINAISYINNITTLIRGGFDPRP